MVFHDDMSVEATNLGKGKCVHWVLENRPHILSKQVKTVKQVITHKNFKISFSVNNTSEIQFSTRFVWFNTNIFGFRHSFPYFDMFISEWFMSSSIFA